jgi:hypothetical protein
MKATTSAIQSTEQTTADQPEVKFELNASEEELLEEFGVLVQVEYGYMA